MSEWTQQQQQQYKCLDNTIGFFRMLIVIRFIFPKSSLGRILHRAFLSGCNRIIEPALYPILYKV
jgi:hypothetical protein